MSPPAALRLVAPDARYRLSFLQGMTEFQSEGLPWWSGAEMELATRDFAAFVDNKLADETRTRGPLPPKTHRWAIVGDEFVGRVSVFHDLNDALRQDGGHIGYDTVPRFRGRGYATEMLKQALSLARDLGLTEVLLTCDDSNVASMRVIQRNGGRPLDAAETSKKRYFSIALG